TIRLDTSSIGEKGGLVSFGTNDSDENPFQFNISGVVTASSGGGGGDGGGTGGGGGDGGGTGGGGGGGDGGGSGGLIDEDFAEGAANFTVLGGSWQVVGGKYRNTTGTTAGSPPHNHRTHNQPHHD